MERNRQPGLTNQLYSFVQNLSEEARAQDRVVLAVSLPSLLDEMTPEDEGDFDRFQKMLDRLGKAMIMSAETETSEIIRRRLFEWGGSPDEGKKSAQEYGEFIIDIRTKKESHAVRLDKEAVDSIKKSRLHQKVATSIFFESNGGQSKTEATLPEIRLAVAEPDIDIGNIETVLETLSTTCYFLSSEKSRYRFSLSPNLNKLLADRRASVQPKKIQDTLRAEVQRVFR